MRGAERRMSNTEMAAGRPQPSPGATSEIRSALDIVWPDQLRTLLLRACLCKRAEAEAAWRDFRERTGDTKRFFESDMTGLKGLLPLVYAAARRNELALGKDLQSYLRVATAREALRTKVCREMHAGVLQALDRAGLPAIALKGGALADTAYETPVERHCHAIHLLVRPDAMRGIDRVVRACGFRPTRLVEARPGARRGFRHEDGLPLVVNAGLYDPPIYRDDPDALWSASTPATIAGVSARVPAPTHHLIYVLASAYHERERGHLRWACDGWLLIHGRTAIDWNEFVRKVQGSRLELPVDTMLRYLAVRLGAPVPGQAIASLDDRAEQARRPALEAAFSGAVVGVSSFREMWFRRVRSRAGRSLLLRFLFLPSADYLLYRFGPGARAWGPLRHAYRPLAYVAQRLWWRALGLPGVNRLTHRQRVAAALAKART